MSLKCIKPITKKIFSFRATGYAKRETLLLASKDVVYPKYVSRDQISRDFSQKKGGGLSPIQFKGSLIPDQLDLDLAKQSCISSCVLHMELL